MRYINLVIAFLLVGMLGCSGDSLFGLEVENQAVTSLAKKTAPSLQSTIEYYLPFVCDREVPGPPEVDSDGRRLVWTGDIHGEIEGEIDWWFYPGGGPAAPPASARFYSARWEIWEGESREDGLLLAGESSGKTTFPPGKVGLWRGNGKVTEAYASYADWNGRVIKEGGSVVQGECPDISGYPGRLGTFGEGFFRVN